jgi:hypothetical protein
MSINTDIGVCANKHRGNPESVRANHLRRGVEGRRLILDLIGQEPLSMKEIALLLGKQLNTCSGRASELKALGFSGAHHRRDTGLGQRY